MNWSSIRNAMLLVIPSSIAEIKATDKGCFLINNNDFFMMRPEELSADNASVRMANDPNVGISSIERHLGVQGVDC